MEDRPTRASDEERNYLRGTAAEPWWQRHRLGIAAGVVMLLLLLTQLMGENGLPAYLALRSEHASLQERVERRRVQEAELRGWIDALGTDPAVLEKLARERYNMHRPGERVYEVLEGQNAADRSP